MYVENTTRGAVLATDARRATGFGRFRGLLGTSGLPPNTGLLLPKTKQVHMFFMRYPIDVAFLSKDNTVVACVHDLQPWRVSPLIREASCALELPVGTLQQTGTSPGDHLRFSDNH